MGHVRHASRALARTFQKANFSAQARVQVAEVAETIAARPAFTQADVPRITNLSTTDAVDELLHGCGFCVYDGLLTPEEVATTQLAIERIVKHQSAAQAQDTREVEGETGHDQIYGRAEGRSQGTRIWNLLNKGLIFEKLVQLPQVMEVFDNLLGDDHCLGSLAGNYLQPNAAGQNPHLDYPYWDYNNGEGGGRGAWPHRPKGSNSFTMNCQMLMMVHDFTLENGPTAVLPYSQRDITWPDDDAFAKDQFFVTGKAGTVLLFTGLLHHCSTPNNSNGGRASILGQYLPKYVRPMEDLDRQVCQDVRERATPKLRTLLGEAQVYPKLFETPTEKSVLWDADVAPV